jgi:hypothetical protein
LPTVVWSLVSSISAFADRDECVDVGAALEACVGRGDLVHNGAEYRQVLRSGALGNERRTGRRRRGDAVTDESSPTVSGPASA